MLVAMYAHAGDAVVVIGDDPNLADNAADDGSNAWPSLHTLARKTLLDVRTVRRILRRLQAGGHLYVAVAAGPKGANRYTILMRKPDPATAPTPVDGDVDEPVDDRTSPPGGTTGGQSAPGHQQPGSPDATTSGDPGCNTAPQTSNTSENCPCGRELPPGDTPPSPSDVSRCLKHPHQPAAHCSSCRSEWLGGCG
jgi:hypothetical protein